MRVKASSLKQGDKFLHPETNEVCVVVEEDSNPQGVSTGAVNINTGSFEPLPYCGDVSKVEGFRMYYDKRLT